MHPNSLPLCERDGVRVAYGNSPAQLREQPDGGVLDKLSSV